MSPEERAANGYMEPCWIMLVDSTQQCLGCREDIYTGEQVYSLTGSEGAVYCGRCGPRAEQAMLQNATHRERERRIIAGLPV